MNLFLVSFSCVLKSKLFSFPRYDIEFDDDEDVDAESDSEPAVKQPKLSEDQTPSSTCDEVPHHFCHVTLSPDDVTDLQSLSPQFSSDDVNKLRCLVAELSPGDMLYLPASWFHEVIIVFCSLFVSQRRGYVHWHKDWVKR